MAAGTLNITIEQGATWDYTLTWSAYDADNPPTYAGDPVDLTDYTARAQIRESFASETALLSMTTENGRITLGGAAGTIALHISAADTEDLDFPTNFIKGIKGVWDLEMVKQVGYETYVTRLVQGSVTLSREVTR